MRTIGLIALILLFTGCRGDGEQTGSAEPAQDAAVEAADDVEGAADEAGDAVEDAADEAGDAMEDAGEDTGESIPPEDGPPPDGA